MQRTDAGDRRARGAPIFRCSAQACRMEGRAGPHTLEDMRSADQAKSKPVS